MSSYQLAQLNIAELKFPLDSPEVSDFVNNLERINQLAENSEGFMWRLQTEEGDATNIDFFGKDSIVNMSVRENIEHLHNYVYRTAHVEIMSRKKEWFQNMHEAHMVLWWIQEGHIPSVEEADLKLQKLRTMGPTREAFTFKKAFPAPSETSSNRESSFDGVCPAT